MEIIQADRLSDYSRIDSDIYVRDSSGWLHLLSPWEARKVISRSYVVGVVKKRQLQYLRATVSRQRIMAEINHLRIEPSAHVTRIRTATTAKKWKQCLDRADSGQVGTHRSVFVGIPQFWAAGKKARKDRFGVAA